LQNSKSEQLLIRINCQCGGHYLNTISDKKQHQQTKIHQQYMEEKHKLDLMRKRLKQYEGHTIRISYLRKDGKKTSMCGDMLRVTHKRVSLARNSGDYKIELERIDDFVEVRYPQQS